MIGREVSTPGRHKDYRHAECHFDYITPAATQQPEEYPTPDKIKTVDKSKWKKKQRICNVACADCGNGAPKLDVPLKDPATDSVCKSKCKRKCDTKFPLAVRNKIRKLRHTAYQKGLFHVLRM